jgi:CO/xanthine dehydrogenase FAD-binding subunit
VISSIEAVRPGSLDDALGQLAARPELRVLAGGTDLMVLINAGVESPASVMDVWHLDELREITVEDGHVVLGALTTYTELMTRPEVLEHLPALAEAAGTVGAVQIQNRGTLGGNIMNASPAGDSLPPLAVYGAELELSSVRGRRRVPFNRFYSGYKILDRAPDEMLTRVRVPVPAAGLRHWFRKVGTRQAQSISKVVAAGLVRVREDGTLAEARLAMGSVAPTVVRLPATEALLEGRLPEGSLVEEVRASVRAEVHPIDDIRSTERYRLAVAGNVVARFVAGLAEH